MNYKGLKLPCLIISALLLSSLARAEVTYVPSTNEPPPVRREFRAAWIATVGNIDWPSKPGLPVQQQKDELLGLLDLAVKFNLNAVILQVRPGCDALYPSSLEPWSYYLTGAQGQPPAPYYDPLLFAVEEAHKRGLELHAWFNPYRAALLEHKYMLSRNHISRTHPEMVVKYGTHLWLDPGLKSVQDYSVNVVMDVVNRYDIDGVHFDDYYYPYKEQDAQKRDIDFPDYGSWKKYRPTGTLGRDDWRRENVNQFVKRVYDNIKATKPWVKFGLSPFGIWQPGHPQQILGFNSYEKLYADSRKWLANGWLDYCSPQLYWAIDPPDHSFPVLLKWWLEQNAKHRNIWPGLDSQHVGEKWRPEEIVNQVKITRELCDGAAGAVHWNMKALIRTNTNLGAILANGVYSDPAVIPSSSWLDDKFPGKPIMQIEPNGKISWKPAGLEKISLWILQTNTGGHWQTRLLPATTRETVLANSPDAIALTLIDRCGVSSVPVVLQKSMTTGTK